MVRASPGRRGANALSLASWESALARSTVACPGLVHLVDDKPIRRASRMQVATRSGAVAPPRGPHAPNDAGPAVGQRDRWRHYHNQCQEGLRDRSQISHLLTLPIPPHPTHGPNGKAIKAASVIKFL